MYRFLQLLESERFENKRENDAALFVYQLSVLFMMTFSVVSPSICPWHTCLNEKTFPRPHQTLEIFYALHEAVYQTYLYVVICLHCDELIHVGRYEFINTVRMPFNFTFRFSRRTHDVHPSRYTSS